MNLADALRVASRLYQDGKVAEVQTLCTAILMSFPEQADAACLLGVAAFADGRTALAERMLARAVVTRPNFTDAYRNLATLKQQTSLEATATLLRHVLALNPNDDDATCRLGLIRADLGQAEAGATLIHTAVTRSPGHVPYYRALAALHGMRNEQNIAMEWLGRGATLAPNDPAMRELYVIGCADRAGYAVKCGDPIGTASWCRRALSNLAAAPSINRRLYDLLDRLIRIALLAEHVDIAMDVLAVKNRYDFPHISASDIDNFPLTLHGFDDWCRASNIRSQSWTAPAQPVPARVQQDYPDCLRPYIHSLPRLGGSPVGVALDAEVEIVQGFYVKDNYESYALANRRTMLCENPELIVKSPVVPLVGVTPGARSGVFRLPRPYYRTVEVDRPVLFLPSTPNYWHFMIEVLPRLMVRESVRETRDLPIFLFDLRRYHHEMLALVGIPREQLVDARDLVGAGVSQVLYRLKRATLTSAIPYSVAYRWLRERLLPLRRPDRSATPRRLFLSRRGSNPKHRIANDAEVATCLARYDFAVVQPETLGVLETVKLISQAEIVVAPIGAGTANQVFLPSNGTWVHLHNPDFFRPGSVWNSQMGTQVTLVGSCRQLVGHFTDDPSALPEQPLDRLDVPIEIDPRALSRLIEQVIAG